MCMSRARLTSRFALPQSVSTRVKANSNDVPGLDSLASLTSLSGSLGSYITNPLEVIIFPSRTTLS